MVKRSSRLATGAALAALACAPAITVRPGTASSPTAFRVRSSARAVTLAGSMTGWRLLPLQRSDGSFALDVALAPGRYEYRLEALDDTGSHEIVPEGAERAQDGFGSENTVLRIR